MTIFLNINFVYFKNNHYVEIKAAAPSLLKPKTPTTETEMKKCWIIINMKEVLSIIYSILLLLGRKCSCVVRD